MPFAHVLAANAVHQQQELFKKGETPENAGEKSYIQPVLIDTDAGIDDAWGLMLMLQAHKNPDIPFNVEAITCVNGNTTVDNVIRNVGRVLATSNVSDIPIFRGCESAFVVPFVEEENPYNGFDGFGDADLPPIENPVVQEGHAVNAIISLAEHHKGNLTILALGPLTNLAMALRMQPKITDFVKEIFVLGGNVEGYGNATVCGEFNFVADVESAHVVLSSFGCPIYLLPSETCCKYANSPYTWRLNTVGNIQTPEMKLLNAIEAKLLDAHRDGWTCCDGLAAALFINYKVIKKSEPFYCVMELQGTHSRGLIIVDRNFKFQKKPNVMVITDVDLQLLQKMLIWAVGGPFYQ